MLMLWAKRRMSFNLPSVFVPHVFAGCRCVARGRRADAGGASADALLSPPPGGSAHSLAVREGGCVVSRRPLPRQARAALRADAAAHACGSWRGGDGMVCFVL